MPRTPKTAGELTDELKNAGDPKNREGMARFGIEVSRALGVSMPDIRKIGRTAVRDHDVALELWDSGLHEARILAALVEEPEKVSREQMNRWAGEFNSWDLCDQVTGNLFDRLPHADEAIEDWRLDRREFVKRAAFAMIAWRAVHLKSEPDESFVKYLPMIAEAAADERNFVRKSVNWALRQIGKRNASLHPHALTVAKQLENSSNKTSIWIGRDAVRELTSTKVLERLGPTKDYST